MLKSNTLRVFSWILLTGTFITALAIGVIDRSDVQTSADRAADLAATIACPQCSGQPVSESNAPIAEVIRAEIKNQVDNGLTDGEIRSFYRSKYGDWVDLNPRNDGIEALVWVSPFLIAGIAAGGMALAFSRRDNDGGSEELTEDAKKIVERLRSEYEIDQSSGSGNDGE
ncbi:MAG: hypothetical protein CL470_02875 [Acidimicrobiaceae bacterium]|nr:hypothetical protein [Acidimicrobiaceae bacterium]|tara:strand:- start:713 stop:1222 length:510 start_codon:yes stop_codon:yes gene_type:complete